MPPDTPPPVYAALRLAPAFDADLLLADLAGLTDADWAPHFNTGYHNGGWFGVPLRAVAGSVNPLYPDPAQTHFEDLPVLASRPAIQAALAAFRCPLRSVRLLKLRAGGVIREHRDDGLGFEHGEVRLHIPVVTNADTAFHLDGQCLPMAPGETWYVNVNLPHRVRNAGATDRIHLVIDCIVNDWLIALFAEGQGFAQVRAEAAVCAQSSVPVEQRLAALRPCVWRDGPLQARLFETEDADLFVREVSAAAAELGQPLSADEIRRALRQARQTWNQRHIIR